MSPQPSRVDTSAKEASVVGDDLVFGEDPRSLAIPRPLVAQIWTQVYQGMRTLSRGGLEVGGLLVGPKADGGRVVVDSIIPLPIEYRHGPSLQMSSSDLAKIGPAIESLQDDPSKVVVGFYRSRTRGDATLRESDHDIIDAIEEAHLSFAEDFRCCFVLSPMSESVALACLALRNGDGWDEMQPFTVRPDLPPGSTLPSSTALLQMPRNSHAEEYPVESPVSRSAVQPVLEHRVSEQQPTTLAVGGSASRRGRIWLYAAACLMIAAGAAGVYRWSVRKQAQAAANARAQEVAPRTHLGFSATLDGPVWKLAWDRAAMDALNPTAAVLSIEDSGYAQQIPLAPADLASGTIFYTPQSSDLTFRLRIDRGGEPIEEHVRVLGAPRITPKAADRTPQSAPAKAPVQARAETNGAPRAQAPPPPASSQAPPVSANPSLNSTSPGTVTPKEPVIASTPDREVKSAPTPTPQATAVAIAIPVPPPAEPRPNVAATTPTPTVVAATQPAPTPAPSATSTPPPASQQVVRPPATPASPPPESVQTPVARDGNELAKGTPAPAPVSPAPTPAPQAVAAKTNYVGPAPIQQVRPKVPANIPPGVSQVQVQVDIDVHGKVTKVTPIGGTVTNAPLMILAVRAASSWLFNPAQLNGTAVTSQMNLTFRF